VIDTGIPGTTVRRVDHLPDTLEGATRVGPFSVARPGALLRVVPGVGRFFAYDGTTLDYCTEPGAPSDAVEALLEGGVLGALIHQRGELPFHASTLIAPQRDVVVAIAGESGSGKSTTTFELIRRGWMMLSDDLTRVTIEERTPIVWPGRSRLRLTGDACARFGIDTTACAPVPNWPDKYMIDVERWHEPRPLDALIALARNDGPLEIERMSGAAALRAIAEQTYRLHYVTALGQTRRHLELVAATASFTAVFRTRGRGSVAEVASAIESSVKKD
jgi:hypothetical protein